jgi:hypothetical protein
MMRRCRDIGWPIFLPWSAQALQFLMVFLLFTSGGLSGGMGAARTVSSGSLLIGFADFVLVIVLGCVRSRHVDVDYAEVFGGEPAALRAHPSPAPYGVAADDRPSAIQAREDAAIDARWPPIAIAPPNPPPPHRAPRPSSLRPARPDSAARGCESWRWPPCA